MTDEQTTELVALRTDVEDIKATTDVEAYYIALMRTIAVALDCPVTYAIVLSAAATIFIQRNIQQSRR